MLQICKVDKKLYYSKRNNKIDQIYSNEKRITFRVAVLLLTHIQVLEYTT